MVLARFNIYTSSYLLSGHCFVNKSACACDCVCIVYIYIYKSGRVMYASHSHVLVYWKKKYWGLRINGLQYNIRTLCSFIRYSVCSMYWYSYIYTIFLLLFIYNTKEISLLYRSERLFMYNLCSHMKIDCLFCANEWRLNVYVDRMLLHNKIKSCIYSLHKKLYHNATEDGLENCIVFIFK